VEFIVLVCLVLFVGSLLIPHTCGGGARERARRIQCLNNLRQIGLAMNAYAADHDGKFPDSGTCNLAADFRLLHPYAGNAGQIFKCPSDTGKTMTNRIDTISADNISYTYVRGLNDETSAQTPISFDRGIIQPTDLEPLSAFAARRWENRSPHKNDGGNVLFAGTHVSFFSAFPKPELGANWNTNIVEVP